MGDWHTHPEPEPSPSNHDYSNWRTITQKAVFEQDFLVFIIVGTKDIRVWEVDKNTGRITQLLSA